MHDFTNLYLKSLLQNEAFFLLKNNLEKLYKYQDDIYLREVLEDLSLIKNNHSVAHFLESYTYVILKPECIISQKIEECLSILKKFEFIPILSIPFQNNRYIIRELWKYQSNLLRKERIDFIDILASSEKSVFILLKSNVEFCDQTASERLSYLKGSTANKYNSKESIRNLLGCNCKLLNFIHTPDEPLDFVRELGVLLNISKRKKVFGLVFKHKTALRNLKSLYRVGKHDLNFILSKQRFFKVINNNLLISDAKKVQIINKLENFTNNDFYQLLTLIPKKNLKDNIWDFNVIIAFQIESNIEAI